MKARYAIQQQIPHQLQETSWKFLTQLDEISHPGQKHHIIFPAGIELVLLDFVTAGGAFHQVSIDQAPVELSFHLAGHARATMHYSRQSREEIICNPDSSFLSFLPQTECRLQLAEKQHYRLVNIYISPEVFWRKFIGQPDCLPPELVKILESGKQQSYNRISSMSCQLRTLVEQIFYCPYRGAMRQLYLEAKTVEIIVRHLWELARIPLQNSSFSLSCSERDKIYAARELLLCNLAEPPSLDMLAREVGLNPNKLNKGFRQEFGMTVFAWYRKARIQQACTLLEQGQLNIDETAQTLGFHDTPHFIRHFKRYCGKTPGIYAREKRN